MTSDPKKPASDANHAEETIQAIHQGQVDAIVVQGPDGPRVVVLDDAAEPYRVLVERMSDGALTFDANGTMLYVNRRLAELTGLKRDDLIGRNFRSLFTGIPPLLLDNITFEAQIRGAGEPVPVSVWTSPITIGGLTATLCTLTDLTVHRRAEEIANAERFARSILEQATDAIVVLTPDGYIRHASWMAEEIAEQPPVGHRFSEVFPLEVERTSQAGVLARFSRESLDRMLATKPFHGVEVKLSAPRLARRSFLLSAGPLVNETKQSVGSIVSLVEITERKRAEEQQHVLVAELNHRVKNILAIVLAVAGQTIRTASSLSSFNTTFTGRMKALSIAHDILTETRWIGIGLKELLLAVLGAHHGDESRIILSGPPVLLPAQMVMPLSLIFHELATNASKYGALSGARGKVAIEWTSSGALPPSIQILWEEQDGPKVEQSAHAGFGTTLIRRVTEYDLDGEVDLTFGELGVRGQLRFPLKENTLLATSQGAALSAD